MGKKLHLLTVTLKASEGLRTSSRKVGSVIKFGGLQLSAQLLVRGSCFLWSSLTVNLLNNHSSVCCAPVSGCLLRISKSSQSPSRSLCPVDRQMALQCQVKSLSCFPMPAPNSRDRPVRRGSPRQLPLEPENKADMFNRSYDSLLSFCTHYNTFYTSQTDINNAFCAYSIENPEGLQGSIWNSS